GDIALYAGLAGGAESIIIPEVGMDVDKVCKKLIQGRNRGKRHSIIILAEGVGGAIELGKIIEEKTGIETRSTILGHIQRGGTPTAFDRILASKMGAKAVDLLLNGKGNLALGIKCNEIISMDIGKALSLEKQLDREIYELADILSI
ncbi:MAG: ATP-dependent 6-phosphofructokinase, partial [Clostridiales bacterium]|nr:ATP-dependent 6-phosphofructokinase [Clostridiales bacterium]